MVSDVDIGGDTDPVASTTSSTPPTIETIVDTISMALDTAPTELPPLYEAVDISAVERVLATGQGSVTFRYQRLDVTVDADGTVEVYPVDDA